MDTMKQIGTAVLNFLAVAMIFAWAIAWSHLVEVIVTK